MRILLVPPNDWLSHPLSSRHHFIFERLARSNQVHVLNFRIGRFGGKQLRSTATRLHEATFFPTNGLSAYYVLNAPYHYKKIGEIIKKNDIEVVVTSNILASYIACVVSRRNRIPIVYDYSDHFPASASIYYRNAGAKTLVKNVVEVLVKQNLAYADKVVVPSKSLEKMMLTKYKMCYNKLSIIPNGVDLKIFKPRNRIDALETIRRLELQDYLLIVFVGSIESRFDLETPIVIVNKLATEGMKVKFLIVGPELSKYHFYLKSKYCKSLGIEFIGYVDNELVPFYINAADICIAPYRVIQMNFSITLKLLEYLASGKTTFITDIPDARKIFGKNLVIYQDSNDLKEKILDVQRSKSEYYSFNTKESSELVSQYSWDRIAASYERLLENLVGVHS